MSKNTPTFTTKIEDLEIEEMGAADDFFESFFKNADTATETHFETLRENASEAHRNSITPGFADEDIDTNWLAEHESYDGQLAVDVYHTENEIVIVSTVAGVKSEDIDIAMNGDMITIKGRRQGKHTNLQDDAYFIRECYWGGFSRSIILPVDVRHDEIAATLEHGILTIRLPKSQRSRNSRINVEDISG